VAGDTVVLMDGVYDRSLYVVNSGTADAWITFEADQCATPIVQGPGVGPTVDQQDFLAWGADITTEEHPLQAGLGFAVDLDAETAFIGRDALRRLQRSEEERRLACLVIDDIRTVALGNEPVKVDGATVGRVTSAGSGYSLGCSIVFAYVRPDAAEVGTEAVVEVFGEDVPARVAAMPLWDPERTRVRS
jgi:glycine cleavage system aminomethyltransferase T